MSDNPTASARTFAAECADEMESALIHIEDVAKKLLAQRVYVNGVRATTAAIKDRANEVRDLVPKLRKAILDDLGAEPEKPKLTNEMRGPEKLAEDAQDILAEMQKGDTE